MASSAAAERNPSISRMGRPKGRPAQKRVALVGAAGLALAMIAATPPALAEDPPPGPPPNAVAVGLNSPRHLSFAPNGDLYISESGVPGITEGADCVVHPEFGPTCLTANSSITRLTRRGQQSRVVTGLPSLSSADEAIGAFDVLLHGNRLTVAMGLGAPPEIRGELEGADAALLGSVIEIKQTGKKQRVSTLADLAAYEDAKDPDERGPDSNPVDLAWSGRNLIVTDAGANAVLKVPKRGAIRELAVFTDPVWMDPPPFPPPSGVWPDPFPAEPVPTAAVKGPDGAWYVSELTGFPFQQGTSTIWRVDRRGDVTEYATGLTNVTDLAWRGRTLYAVQLADAGLLGGPVGSLVKVSTSGAHKTVAGGLFAPYGVAIKGGHAYVTVGSVAPGGMVLKFSLS